MTCSCIGSYVFGQWHVVARDERCPDHGVCRDCGTDLEAGTCPQCEDDEDE